MAKRSLGVKIMLYSLLMIMMALAIVIISNVSSNGYLSAYTENADLYRELDGFYRSMQGARESAENFFYARSERHLDEYKHNLAKSGASLVRMGEIAHSDTLKFRLAILRNMLESCDERFEKMLLSSDGRPSYGGDYANLIYLFELTNSTQREYYGYLVEYSEQRRKEIVTALSANAALMLVVVGAIAVTAAAFSVLLSRWITRPINSIVNNIQRIKSGEYDLRAIKDAGPEFAVLGDAFDDMAVSIRSNIDTIENNARLRQQLLEAENKNLRINELLTVSELRALQGQMNPHFLFNTLSMIAQIASMESALQTAELIGVTTRLLRYCLDKANKNATLSEEIECVRNYLHIQRMRFGERVSFNMFVEKGLPDIMLPGMLLQPIIENSVTHGMAGIAREATVSISITRDAGALNISVEDDGRGMPSERLEWLMNDDLRAKDEGGEHIGLLNSKKRIEMLYGSFARFYIDSSEGVGTIVSITIDEQGLHGGLKGVSRCVIG